MRVGDRYGRLTVISIDEGRKYTCKCDCGNVVSVNRSNLPSGHTKSCGCLKQEIISAGAHTIHGGAGTRLYKIWKGMRKRCRNANGNRADNYINKGIKVCEEWQDYQTFETWAMANGYADDLSIDRIDNDGDYCPENCRWATAKEQANNRSRNRFIDCKGERHTIAEWSDITGIPQANIEARLRLGWTVEKTLGK